MNELNIFKCKWNRVASAIELSGQVILSLIEIERFEIMR